jgi:hypothetical protein
MCQLSAELSGQSCGKSAAEKKYLKKEIIKILRTFILKKFPFKRAVLFHISAELSG